MIRARVPAAAAWSSDSDALVRAMEIVGQTDASGCWREEYRAQAVPLPGGDGR
jgi:hypothetical protein